MQDGYIIGRYRGRFGAELFVDGRRAGRFTLGTAQQEAERQIKELNDRRAAPNSPNS